MTGRILTKFIALALTGILLLSGCARNSGDSSGMSEWEKAAKLNAHETADELYEAAKAEDVLTVYTVSSRVFDVVESFQARYPGLLVEATYYRAEEIKDKLYEAKANGQAGCDLIFTTNGDGNLTQNLIPDHLAYKYIPYDIEDKMRKGGSSEYVSVLLEAPLLAYNSEVYTDGAPLTNWWELTGPEWKGKLYVTDPSKSNISYTVFSMLISNKDMLEEAYLEHFGTKYSAQNGESAGECLIRKLVENDMHVLNDSDDVANAVAAPGTGADGIGLLNASKLRLNDRGYTLENITDMKPFAGVINPANIMIVGGAKNVNCAKLFIRWMLGETDGEGEGYTPFLGVGAWPAREDVTRGDSRNLNNLNVIYTDEKYTAENREAFLDMWSGLIDRK